MTTPSIAEIARKDYPVLSPNMPMQEAITLLVQMNSAAAPVTNEIGALVGVLTQKDCFRPALLAAYHGEWRGIVADHMSPDVFTINHDEDIIYAAEIFLEKPHRQLPVVEGTKLVGMLHRTDVLAVLAEVDRSKS